MASTEFPHDKKQAAAQVAKLKKANAAKKKPAAKKKGRSILGRLIRGEKVLYDMKKRKLILEPENKKKPVTKKKPIKKKAK